MTTLKDQPITPQQEYDRTMADYYTAEYIGQLQLSSIQDQKIGRILQEKFYYTRSHKNRITKNIQYLKYVYVFGRADIIVTCFKIILDEVNCIYAYLYSRCIGQRISEESDRVEHDLEHLFICTGPTFHSQDGEYRARVISWKQYMDLMQKYEDTIAMVEALIVGKMIEGRMTFQVDFYYPVKCNATTIESFINNMRLPIYFFALCWICDYYEYNEKISPNHINPAYKLIIHDADNPDDKETFDEIIQKIGRDEYLSMKYRIEYAFPDINAGNKYLSELGCGQKIIPMNAYEISAPNDICYSIWREIYLSSLTSNLVLNLLSPSFPFINNWFYIQNAHGGLFDNLAMHEKYDHSDIASGVAERLKAADEFNYVNHDRDEGPINKKFGRLSYKLYDAISYADRDIKLTDLAICITSEYVGRTLRDIPILVKNGANIPDIDTVFGDPNIFRKHIFEFLYGFDCMNRNFGIIHGDFHLNNATIYRLYRMPTKESAHYIADPSIAYICDDDVYIFPHRGLFSMIIDFSRGIICDKEKLEHDFGPIYTEKYLIEQQTRIMSMIYHYFPKLVNAYNAKLSQLITVDLALAFKILTAIDTYVLANGLLTMFTTSPIFKNQPGIVINTSDASDISSGTLSNIKLAANAIDLVTKISTSAEKFISMNLIAAMDGRITCNDIPWFNRDMIKTHFRDFIYTSNKAPTLDASSINLNANGPGTSSQTIPTIIEIFNNNAKLNSNIDDYSTWGPLLNIDKENELRKKFGLELDPIAVRWAEYRSHDESDIIDAITDKYKEKNPNIDKWALL